MTINILQITLLIEPESTSKVLEDELVPDFLFLPLSISLVLLVAAHGFTNLLTESLGVPLGLMLVVFLSALRAEHVHLPVVHLEDLADLELLVLFIRIVLPLLFKSSLLLVKLEFREPLVNRVIKS